ncbi:hypothetical protein ACQ4PT_003444 [Festuca glaucescens]
MEEDAPPPRLPQPQFVPGDYLEELAPGDFVEEHNLDTVVGLISRSSQRDADKADEWRRIAEEQGKVFVDLGSETGVTRLFDAPPPRHRAPVSIPEPILSSRKKQSIYVQNPDGMGAADIENPDGGDYVVAAAAPKEDADADAAMTTRSLPDEAFQWCGSIMTCCYLALVLYVSYGTVMSHPATGEMRFVLCLCAAVLAAATAVFISNVAVLLAHDISTTTGRSRTLLQTGRKACPVNLAAANYTVLTSRCRWPPFEPLPCCAAFKNLACPYALTTSTTSTATTAPLPCSVVMYSARVDKLRME